MYRGKTYQFFGSNGYWFSAEGITGYYLPIVDNFEVTVSSTDTQRGTALGSGFYMEGDTVTIRAVPSLGYIFSYWDDGDTANPRRIVVSQDTAFSAIFDLAVSFNVSTSENNPAWGYVTGGGQHFEGETVTLTAIPSLVSVMFDHWNDGNTANPRQFTLTQDTAFTAFFRERELYSVSALANNPAWGSVTGGGNYYECDAVTLQAVPANSHCLFVSWDDSVTANPRTFIATGDTAFTALFREKALFTLTAVPNNPDWGSVTGSGTYYDGTYVVMQVSPANEYCTFVGWHDGNTYNPRAVTMDRDTSFVAIFSEIPLYTISVESNNIEWGDALGGGRYREGETATLRAYPSNEHYSFLRWNDGDTDNPRTITVLQDSAFTAIFGTKEGIDSPDGEGLRVTLSPNPASSSLTVSASREDRYTLSLFDRLGRCLTEMSFSGTACKLDVSALPRGQYIVKLLSDSVVSTLSFVKQ